jgi:hypothetical protein
MNTAGRQGGRRLDGDGSSRSLAAASHQPLPRGKTHRQGKSLPLAGRGHPCPPPPLPLTPSLFLTSCPLACCCHLHLYFRPCDAWLLHEARRDIDVSTISSIFFFSFYFSSSSRLTYTSIIRMFVAAPINSAAACLAIACPVAFFSLGFAVGDQLGGREPRRPARLGGGGGVCFWTGLAGSLRCWHGSIKSGDPCGCSRPLI